MQENENREFQRLKIPLDVDAVIGEKIVQSQILNISSSGLFIITTPGKFQPGTLARVVFVVPGYNQSRPLKLHGKSVRVEPKGVAIKFEGVSPYFLKMLNEALLEVEDGLTG